MEEEELSEPLKKPIVDGVRNELEEINEKLKRYFPKQRASLQVQEDMELLKAFLNSDLAYLNAQVKRKKFVALKRAGFTEEQALRLMD